MSNTSNRWKSQGGINRRAMNNILSNNKQATNTLTIPQQLGISNTTIEQYGDVHDISNTVLNNTQIGGTLDITGEMKVYNEATFHETAYFYKGVVDSCNTIIYDTSAVNHIDIFTTSDDTSHTASIFIQNAHGVTNSGNHMPSMLVYNQEILTNQVMSTASMENLIFSISGENVSIGEIYGQNTFDVSGNSSFLGKVGIGKSETSMVTLDSATLDVSGSVSISGGTSIYGSLDVSGICTMDQQSGFSSKNKINIIPIPNPLLTDFSGNTSDINMWGTFTNTGNYIYDAAGSVNYRDNKPRQTATIQSGYSNQINSNYSTNNSAEFKGAWGGEYLSFKVGNHDSDLSPNMANDSSMTPSTFSDIINVDLNNEVMRITAEGNVGIGTDSPTSTLDVEGTLGVTKGIICGDGGKGTGIFVGSNDGQNDNSVNPSISYDEINKKPCYIGVNYTAGDNEVDFHSISSYMNETIDSVTKKPTNTWTNPPGGFKFYQWSSESEPSINTNTTPKLLCTINKSEGMVLSGDLSGVTGITASGKITDGTASLESGILKGVTSITAGANAEIETSDIIRNAR